MIEAVVIDVDDTLCLTEAACFDLENSALGRVGRDAMSREVHQQTWGMALLDGMEVRSPGIDVQRFQATYQPLLEEYVASGRLDHVTPETLAAVDALIGQGRRVMILTSRTLVELQHLMEPTHALAGRIEAFYHADNTSALKPSGRCSTRCSPSTSSPRTRAYVGDSPGDAQAAAEAGVRFIGCLASGLRTESDLRPHRVDAFVESLSQLVTVVPRLEGASLQER